uniref:Uncharacterized protein n=1 Tax=Eucampia antarctica TaxID=49252 RepID=A0A7S2RJ33_9STRA
MSLRTILLLIAYLNLGDAWTSHIPSSSKTAAMREFQTKKRNMLSPTKMLFDDSTGQGIVDFLSSSTTSIVVEEPYISDFLKHSSVIIADESTKSAVISSSTDRMSDSGIITIFILGCIPFAWATVEFWRRIAVGASFGTGKDSIIIGKEGVPNESRGRQVLGKDALVVAYILFSIAAASIGLAVWSVVSSSAPPPFTPTIIS